MITSTSTSGTMGVLCGTDTVPSLLLSTLKSKDNTMGKTFTTDHKANTVAMYLHNSRKDTAMEMGTTIETVTNWYNKAGSPPRSYIRPVPKKISERFHTLEMKHTICSYYSNHTGDQTSEKFGVSTHSIHMWRKDLGYPNKHYGRNIKHDRTDNDVKSFKVTKTASGKYRASILQDAVTALTAAVVALKGLE